MIIHEAEMKVLDEEWLDLICEAKAIGLSIEEIRAFLNQNVTGDQLVFT